MNNLNGQVKQKSFFLVWKLATMKFEISVEIYPNHRLKFMITGNRLRSKSILI